MAAAVANWRISSVELHAEAKRRFQRATPNLPIEYFDRWLASALARGGTIVLTLDGAYASYDRPEAPQGLVGSDRGLR